MATVKACWRYIEGTFQDSPSGSGTPSMPYAGWPAHMIHKIALSYGWNEAAILNMPLKRIYQYLKCIRRHHDSQAPMHNPSDKVKGDFARLLNARNDLLKVLKRRAN